MSGPGDILGPIVATTAPTVALTFDDGPDPRLTPAVLDVLASHGATATFFVLMSKVESARALLADVVAAGHEVGLHGPDHRPVTDFPADELARRIGSARSELEDLVGQPTRWFRPPYGRHSVRSYRVVRRCGLSTVLWSATTWDWKDVSDQERLRKSLEGGVPGAILLAHDGMIDAADGAPDEDITDCDRPALLDRVLREYSARGLQFGSLGAALSSGSARRSVRSLLRTAR